MYYPLPVRITIHFGEDNKSFLFNSFNLQMRNPKPKMLNDILNDTTQAEGSAGSRNLEA